MRSCTSYAVAHLPRYLLPSRLPTKPANPQALYALLGRYGIPIAARNTAMLALAADLPAPVLASLVGIAPSIAASWSRLARTDWTGYLAAREHQPENTKVSTSLDRVSFGVVEFQHHSLYGCE